jgi:hypothetical protein
MIVEKLPMKCVPMCPNSWKILCRVAGLFSIPSITSKTVVQNSLPSHQIAELVEIAANHSIWDNPGRLRGLAPDYFEDTKFDQKEN